MSKLIRLALPAALALAGLNAQAVLVDISNAAFAATYTRDCRSAAARAASSTTPDLCEASPSGLFQGITKVDNQYSANLGGFTASAFSLSGLSMSGGHTTQSTVDASGPAGSLVLHQLTTTSTSYARASGHSEALQSFQWTGADGAIRAVSGSMDFTASNFILASNNVNGDTSARTFGQASIRIFSLDAAAFTYDTDNIHVPGSPAWAALPQFADAASTQHDYHFEAGQAVGDVVDVNAVYNPATGKYEASWNYEFTVHTGRYYFVESWMGLWSLFGGEIDGSHTFVTQLGENQHDPSGAVTGFTATLDGFTPAAASDNPVGVTNIVPEPASLALAGMAFVGLLGGRRRTPRR